MSFVKKIFSSDYYVAILQGSQKYNVFLAVLVLALVSSIVPIFLVFKDVYPVVKNLNDRVLATIDEVYPDELEITIKNGLASTNVSEPYYITIRRGALENLFSLKEDDQSGISKIRILSIDTKGSVEDFDRYQSLALLTESSLVYYNDKKINVNSLREVKDVVITKAWINQKYLEINKDNRIGSWLNIAVLVSPLLIILGIFIAEILSCLFIAVGMYLMVRINQIQVGFKTTFAYTTAIAVGTSIVWNILLLIPKLNGYLQQLDAFLMIIILGFGYIGIHKLKIARQGVTK